MTSRVTAPALAGAADAAALLVGATNVELVAAVLAAEVAVVAEAPLDVVCAADDETLAVAVVAAGPVSVVTDPLAELPAVVDAPQAARSAVLTIAPAAAALRRNSDRRVRS
jgi:hypothetical protein